LKIVIDSYAWIELFAGTARGGKVKETLENADALYTVDIVLAEIARKYIREGVDDKTVNTRLEQISANSNIISLYPKLAVKAAKCYLEIAEQARKNKLNTPSLTDAIILASTRELNAKILTGDLHFKVMPDVLWI
jgi:predicted nucleic acid-binding protein